MLLACNEKQKPIFSSKSYLITEGDNRKGLVWSEAAKFPVISDEPERM